MQVRLSYQSFREITASQLFAAQMGIHKVCERKEAEEYCQPAIEIIFSYSSHNLLNYLDGYCNLCLPANETAMCKRRKAALNRANSVQSGQACI